MGSQKEGEDFHLAGVCWESKNTIDMVITCNLLVICWWYIGRVTKNCDFYTI